MIFNLRFKSTLVLQALLVLAVQLSAQVASAQVLEIEVDTNSGVITFHNPTASGVEFDLYTITSPAGSLLPGDGSWHSFSDQGLAVSGTWFEAGTSNQSLLAELAPAGSLTIDPGEIFNIGSAYNTSSDSRDLEFSYLPVGQTPLVLGVVRYTAIPEPSTLLLGVLAGTGLLMRRKRAA